MPPTAADDSLPQYSLTGILAIWLAVSLPMPLLAFWVAPRLSAATGLHPGIAIWVLLTGGMIWQFVLSVWLLRREGWRGGWTDFRRRTWLQTPRDPATGRPSARLLWWALPVIVATALVEITPMADWLAAPFLWIAPVLAEVPEPDISSLASPEFVGAWWLVALALVSFAFNYFLGEELLFRGVLLPRMAGVFGRWDWVANAVAFGTYHLIRPLTIPSIVISTLFWTLPSRRYRSIWFSIIPHVVEGLFLLVLVFGVVSGLAF